MKHIFLTLLLFTSTFLLSAQEQGKYFFVKSGYIEYQLTGNSSGKKIIWFDNYGMKMSTLTESATTISILGIKKTTKESNLEIRNGNDIWKIDLLTKKGSKMNIEYASKIGKDLTQNRSDAELLAMERNVIEEFGAKIEGYETLLGHKCLVFKLGSSKFWQYKGIPLRSEVSALGLAKVNEIAIELKENISVPAEKFKLPDGVIFESVQTESNMDLGKLFGGVKSKMREEREMQNDNEEDGKPLNADLTFKQFISAVKSLDIPNLKITSSNEEKESFAVFLNISKQFINLYIVNIEMYDEIRSDKNTEVLKKYTINGNQAVYFNDKRTDSEETKIHSVIIKNKDKQMAVWLSTDRLTPVQLMDDIAARLKF
jgi:hypothetical protein